MKNKDIYYMVNQFVSYEVALKLKELNFDELCLTTFDNYKRLKSIYAIDEEDVEDENLAIDTPYTKYCQNSNIFDGFVAAPLWQQAIDWLRDVERIYISIKSQTDLGRDSFWYEIYRFDSSKIISNHASSGDGYGTFQEAREQAILKAIACIEK